MPMQLYNTLTKRREALTPGDPNRITFYSCGPTVYDDAHIGNFRSFLAADVLRRWLESPLCEVTAPDGSVHMGPREVRHVMNITDVGHMTDDDNADGGGVDKMEAAAKRLLEQKKAGASHMGVVDPNDPRQIADFYAERFLEDARALGLKVALEANESEAKRRELMPKATESIAGMVAMIEDLAKKDYAYRAGDAVYFDVQKYSRYGELSGNTLDKIRSGAGGRVSAEHTSEKRSPADFLLWKTDASHIMRWPGPVIDGQAMGEGYPGWHIECSVMARAALGDVIDLHSGGEDNIFPHHECERAQSCCATGHDTFARHWFHGRFLQVEGEKMSKSKGNFFTARDLFAQGHEPAAVRLELIKTHYRSNANFTMQGLKDSARMIERWRRFYIEGESGPFTEPEPSDASKMIVNFIGDMNDDLNISGAIGAINRWINTTDQPTQGDARCLRMIDEVLGVLSLERAKSTQTEIGVFLDGITPSEEVEGLLAKRADARKAKDFATSDAIRDELAGMGYAIKDVAGGKVEVSRK
ncbi:MAG: cysteine--tRNA ligase [Phycisphaera sp.]|nr:cysteine--tRNA ligase [Phycisphaera sp.]